MRLMKYRLIAMAILFVVGVVVAVIGRINAPPKAEADVTAQVRLAKMLRTEQELDAKSIQVVDYGANMAVTLIKEGSKSKTYTIPREIWDQSTVKK